MTGRNGVEVGQRVRAVDGRDLGRVKALYESGFLVSKGFPILFRRDFVARYDEVRGVRDGALVLARSDQDLLDLANGHVPSSWKIPAPPDFPATATPSEAIGVFEEVAGGAIATGGAGPSAAPPPRPHAPVERTHERSHGEAPSPPPPALRRHA